VPNRGRDKGLVARNVQSNNRKGNIEINKFIQLLIKNNLSTNLFNLFIYILANTQVKKSNIIPAKRKHASSSKKKSTKTITIHSDSEDNCDDNNEDNKENVLNICELEYRERDLALKEREIALREREVKVRIMELTNLEKERELDFVKK
jgi:hypothetical protein